MKKTPFTLCIGILIGLLAGSVTGTFAAVGDRFEAIATEYIIMVDGVEQVLESSPVAINDSTYMPLRAMSNMLGKDVVYKADSRTIELNTPKTVTEGVYGMIYIEPTEEEKKMTLDEINGRILSLKMAIKANEIAIDIQETLTDSDRLLFQSQIVQWQAEIAELQAQKAALESTP